MAGTAETLNEVYVLVIFLVTVLLLLISFGIIQSRGSARARLLRTIPRFTMPISTAFLPNRVSQFVDQETASTRVIQFEPENSVVQADGWGYIDTNASKDRMGQQRPPHFAWVHFKTSIAISCHRLEQLLCERNEKLRRPSTQTVREYITSLCAGENANFPSVNPKLFEYFLDMYERARFGAGEFTLEEYEEFIDRFLDLTAYFKWQCGL